MSNIINPTLTPIAYIRSDFPEKFGIPRQSGLVEELVGRISFVSTYRSYDAIRGLEEFSHIWLIWGFTESDREKWAATVAPPRLGGRVRLGVFATRSPYRPNGIGLSCVRLVRIEDENGGPVLVVAGADLMDKTPIYDIKPYIPMTDCRPDATEGYTAQTRRHALTVHFPEELLIRYPEEKRQAAVEILMQDPRPAYVMDPERIYGVTFAGKDIKFRVNGNLLTVCDVVDVLP